MAIGRPLSALCALALVLALVAASVSAAQGLQPCNCSGGVLDCSYRQKMALVDGEKQCPSASAWNLRGNNLRSFPSLSPNVQSLDISNNEVGLSNPKPHTPGRLRYLDVSSNKLRALSIYDSCGINHLNVSNNELVNLTTIYDCRQLYTLRVAKNNISILSDNMFYQWQSYLRILDLSGNPIHSVASSAFHQLYELETLHLGGSRLLYALPENTFYYLTSLKHLFLNGNNLTKLPSKIFDNLIRLEVLDLQNNNLQALPDSIFRSQSSLQSLNLDNNQLLELPDGLFSRMHSLRQVSARSNRLLRLPSLRECLGPLRAALFNDNLITEADEGVARSYLRFGFELGDLRGNPLRNDSMGWTRAADVAARWDSECVTVSLRTEGHGSLAACVCNPRDNTV